ncbi:MAG: hypothetical protein QUU85_04990, partial [Candidatus Eisenbacteria bacterium]|nr:hypothetical protein [Candidatus Eisenbacteria bacterium]
MDNDELRNLDQVGYDERTETWYLDTREIGRLSLTRRSLDSLVQLYNSVHTGNPLLLGERKTIRRIEENNRRLSETVRDLYLHIDRQRESRVDRVLGRLLRRLWQRAPVSYTHLTL